ncbi:hypothetical protein [Corynebacterium matruchotii]|uniref:hypothetical protein n=1 Tax=Corynebacterium matruchotii TaxID=43768 RepID=UPI0024317A60|nr:hypothetical protein [Corynebacterium matruchotii]
MRHIIPQFVESGILSLPTPLDDATQGALPAWVVRPQPGGPAGSGGGVVWSGAVWCVASLAVWRRHRPHPRPGSTSSKHGL